MQICEKRVPGSKSGDSLSNLPIQFSLELASFVSFFYEYGNSNGSTYHWVVTHSNKSHHLYVSRY